MFDVADFVRRAIRVLNVSYRPKEKEFAKIAKVTGAGILIIGGLGLIISLVFHYI